MNWKTLESSELFSSGLFQLRTDRCELPDGRIMPRYYVLDFPDWVNILPFDDSGNVILIKQYRHPSKKVHIELPGGSSEPGQDAHMEEAAQRELLEETGFAPGRFLNAGSHYPNPALQTNRMHTFVALNCQKVALPNLDPFEDLELYPCSLDQLGEHLKNGEIDHTIMIASLFQGLTYLKKEGLLPKNSFF